MGASCSHDHTVALSSRMFRIVASRHLMKTFATVTATAAPSHLVSCLADMGLYRYRLRSLGLQSFFLLWVRNMIVALAKVIVAFVISRIASTVTKSVIALPTATISTTTAATKATFTPEVSFMTSSPTGTSMEKDFQDIQQLDPEEDDHQLGGGERPRTHEYDPRKEDPFWKGKWTPLHQPRLQQRFCSRYSLSLLVLTFNILLLVVTCVIGSQSEGHRDQEGWGRTQMQMELWTLKEKFNNFSSSTLMEMEALSFHGGSSGNKVTSLETKMEKQLLDLKEDHSTLLLHLKHFSVDLRTLACHMAFFRSNGTECCPVNWVEHEGSCYWFSHSGKTWTEAEKHCRLENAHLVVINSREEQKFLAQHTDPFQTWIGLTDSDGSWKWVDGTDYRLNYRQVPLPLSLASDSHLAFDLIHHHIPSPPTLSPSNSQPPRLQLCTLTPRNWAPTQPDDWTGHEVGGTEDCAEMRWDGRWNDDFCMQMHRWVCEMKSNFTS
ncbi:Asialoglycoprotein receptor 2 [Galemys pyrenaicus]|uniref:Asialoglycoprotein receptor 2 n=1 Tax=Galemys pyrenaicus TaxID=202257 RepID=A0A8J5ZTW7_GALPY|nr:Asialoglycoprotein receptor 2 [Galemys pyrenaicus]